MGLCVPRLWRQSHHCRLLRSRQDAVLSVSSHRTQQPAGSARRHGPLCPPLRGLRRPAARPCWLQVLAATSLNSSRAMRTMLSQGCVGLSRDSAQQGHGQGHAALCRTHRGHLGFRVPRGHQTSRTLLFSEAPQTQPPSHLPFTGAEPLGSEACLLPPRPPSCTHPPPGSPCRSPQVRVCF